VSIGTNDLTQYTLAAERGNAAVDHLADPLDPGVLALIASGRAGRRRDRHRGGGVRRAGQRSDRGRAAGRARGAELSVPPVDVPAVKAAVREVDLADAVQLAERALACASAAEVRALLG
jgi:multiphosphoryl transfer protein